MIKNENFISTKEFNKSMSEVTKKNYNKIQKNLKTLAKNTLKILSDKNL